MPNLPKALDIAAKMPELYEGVAARLSRWAKLEHTIPVKWLASATGFSESYVYGKLDESQPLQRPSLCDVEAAIKGDPAGAGADLLDFLARRWGVCWEWRPRIETPPSSHEATQAVADSAVVGSEAKALEWATLRDGVLEQHELVTLARTWATEDHKREEMRAKLRAMCRGSAPAVRLSRAYPSRSSPRQSGNVKPERKPWDSREVGV